MTIYASTTSARFGFAALAARGESPSAFDRRCIPASTPTRLPRRGPRARGVAQRSNIPDILAFRALRSGRIGGLGATTHFHHGLLGLLLTAVILVAACHAEAQAPVAFDGGRALDHVRALCAIGPRPPGSPGLEQTRKYIREQLGALGVKVTDQAFEPDTPVGKVKMVNLLATIPGTRPERLIIAGHYDTKLFREFRFVGANDAGSSTAFLIEIARVLKGRANPFTIELLFLDGEEAFGEWAGTDHTYGSRYYVEAARRAGTLASLKAMILVDMIGDRDLNIRRESYSTAWMTDILWSTARQMGHEDVFVPEAMAVEDDHMAFLNAGVQAVDIIDLDYAPWHTAGDTLDKVSARSMEIVGNVLTAALPKIEAKLGGK
jgi:glutaminyl-peptide cyclotransferase